MITISLEKSISIEYSWVQKTNPLALLASKIYSNNLDNFMWLELKKYRRTENYKKESDISLTSSLL